MTRISLKTIAEMLHRLKMDGSDGLDRELVKPRLVEGKCFVQAMTQLPGGAEKFCEDFLKASPGWLRSLPPRSEWDSQWQRLDEDYRSEEHTSELQSLRHLVCRLLLEKKKKQ